MRYGVIWHPDSRNLGEDIQALAAGGLLPRIDLALDGERLDEAPPPGEDIIVLLGGHVMRRRFHWPPHPSLRPVCLGAHLSREDAWGTRLDNLEGLGLDYLRSLGPIGCRDDATAALLNGMKIDSYVSCCLTLTLTRPADVPRRGRYICCVDVPERAVESLRRYEKAEHMEIREMTCLTLTLTRPADVPRRGRYICCVDVPERAVESLRRYEKAEHMEIREMTHHLPPEAAGEDFATRMARARETVRTYAGAAWVVTRRLHCALACLALEVPVLLLYNSGYEDPRRFSPMDGLFSVAAVEDFIASVNRSGFPALAENPGKYMSWRRLLKEKAAEGIARAAAAPPRVIPSPEEAARWQRRVLDEVAASSAEKIERLEMEQYDLIHDKFGLLLTEDSVKSRIQDCLTQPGLEEALQNYVLGRYLSTLRWWKRPRARRRLRKLLKAHQPIPELEEEDVLTFLTAQLARLGWPLGKTQGEAVHTEGA